MGLFLEARRIRQGLPALVLTFSFLLPVSAFCQGGNQGNSTNPSSTKQVPPKSEEEEDSGSDKAAKKIVKNDETSAANTKVAADPHSTPEQKQQAEQQIQQATAETNQLVDKFPDSPKVQIEGTKFALNRGDNQTALNRAERVIELEPKRSSGYAYAASAYDKLGDKQKALDYATEALKYDPNSKLARGIVSLYAGRVPLDVKLPKIGSQGAPGEGQAPPSEAQAQKADGQKPLGPAEKLNVKAQAFANQLKVNDLVTQAELKLKLKDYNEAFEQANRAINLDPKDHRARLARARANDGRGNFQGSISDLDTILKEDPNDAAALVERASANLSLGKFEEARADATNAILLDAKNALAYYYRAQAEEKLGRPKESQADYDKAASLDPALSKPADQAVKSDERPASAAARIPRKWLLEGAAALGTLLLLFLGLTLLKESAQKPPKRPTSTDPSRPRPRYATLPPKMILGDKFRIIREVGRGGMGVVYEAEDLSLQRRVAIKQLYRDRHVMQDDLERFVAEARTVAKLKHPNIAEIHQVAEEDELYLVFEFLDGRTLADLIDERHGLSLPETAQIARGMASAVELAHSKGIIHRDLKPGNVMITRDGTAKVMDFGLAHQTKGAKSYSELSVAGTMPYMAPEQHKGEVRKESDLYALGLMLYEMLTGEPLFKGPDYLGEKLRLELPGVTKKNAALPAALDGFFKRALAPDPANRYHDASELLEAFLAAIGEAARNAPKAA